MNLWHEHEDGFVGTHSHATDENAAEFEHTHGADGAVTTAGDSRWKRPKNVSTGEAITLDVHSTQQGVTTTIR